jgi:hypothetical protein
VLDGSGTDTLNMVEERQLYSDPELFSHYR